MLRAKNRVTQLRRVLTLDDIAQEICWLTLATWASMRPTSCAAKHERALDADQQCRATKAARQSSKPLSLPGGCKLVWRVQPWSGGFTIPHATGRTVFSFPCAAVGYMYGAGRNTKTPPDEREPRGR